MAKLTGSDLPPQLIVVAERLRLLLEDSFKKGKKNWYYGSFLADFLKGEFEGTTISDITVRAMVNYLRRKKVPILASSLGYKYSTDKGEIAECIEDLRRREAGIRGARTGLEEILTELQIKNQEKMKL